MDRLDLPLDAKLKRRLEELAEDMGVSISDLVRRLIDDAYERVMLERRIEAVGRLVTLEVEDPPDPATLSRELDAARRPGGLH